MENRKLGVLDFGYFMPPHIQAIDVLNFTFKFVQTLERIGYSRYWMAEHYNDLCSWTNPDILLTVLAGLTEEIKIGIAGVSIYNHNSYKIATTFKMLSALFPNRIDLGIARGGIPEHMQELLNETPNPDYSNKKIIDLLGFLSKEFNCEVDSKYVPLPPYGGGYPKKWLLGTSLKSALESIDLNLSFSLSTFHVKKPLNYYIEIIKVYKEKYHQKFDELPTVNAAVFCSCIRSEKSLNRFIRESNLDLLDSMKIVGNESYCSDKMIELYEKLDINEIIVYDHNRNLEERLESVTLLGSLL